MAEQYPTTLLAARIEDLSWLAGDWFGEIHGDPIEEHWSQPVAGSMVGMFRWLRGDKVHLYELIALEEAPDGLLMYIKHFKSGLRGLEEKDQPVTLAVVRLGATEALFSKVGSPQARWMTYRRADQSLRVFFENTPGEHDPADEYRFTRG